MLVLVGASISGAISLFLDWNLFKFGIATAIAIVLQIAIKWYIDQVKSAKEEQIIKELPAPTIKMNIECAYCRKPNTIDYDVYREEYECEGCKNINSIYGKFYAVRKNTSLDVVINNEQQIS